MKLKFLGISGGLPSPDSGNVSFVVTEDKASLLMEVSGNPIGSLSSCGIDPKDLDALCLSHGHVDHIYALPSLLHGLWLLKRSRSLPIIANAATLDIARMLCGTFGLEQKPGMFQIDWTLVQGRGMEMGPFVLESFQTVHGVPSSGFVVSAGHRKLAYFADTAPLEDNPASAIGANAIIHEAGGIASEEHELNSQGHSSGRQAALAARAISRKEGQTPVLFLCHLPADRMKRAAILSETRIHHTGRSLIPRVFHPYKI